MRERYIGLMSGTSLDGVDGVVVAWGPLGLAVEHAQHQAFAPSLRQELLALNSPGANELHRAALAANALAQAYAQVVHALLKQGGLIPADVCAIGAHGQTVRHHPGPLGQVANPNSPWRAYTLQLNQPALLAELTRITVVADFRSRDIAAGGQGAPLVPAFHQAVFARQPLQKTAVVNIGGMANATLLGPNGLVSGFDTGPGNVLLDLWTERHTGRAYDNCGQWAAQGTVHTPLLETFWSDPFFHLQGVKSTGRDHFNAQWLDAQLTHAPRAAPEDVQATLVELTALSIAQSLRDHTPEKVVVCGGGVFNTLLMQRLQQHVGAAPVVTSDSEGMPAMQVEAAAFAWLARQTMKGWPGNLPAATGAVGLRVLGAVYPA